MRPISAVIALNFHILLRLWHLMLEGQAYIKPARKSQVPQSQKDDEIEDEHSGNGSVSKSSFSRLSWRRLCTIHSSDV